MSRRLRFTVSILSLLVVLMIAQLGHSATISGMVAKEDPPVPAAGVAVRIGSKYGVEMESGGDLTRTDNEGHFEFKKYPAGEYYIGLSDGNFTEGGTYSNYYCTERIKQIFVPDDDSYKTSISFHLTLGATVKGKAMTVDGKPLDVGFAMMDGGLSGFKIGRDGSFSVPGVPNVHNSYRINIFPANFAKKEYAYTRFVDLDEKQLKPGAVVDVGVVQFKPLPTEKNLHGTLTGPDDKPMKGAIIYMAFHATDHVSSGVSVVDGKIDQPMLPGKWNLFAGKDWRRYVGEFEVKPEGITEINLKDSGAKQNDPPAPK